VATWLHRRHHERDDGTVDISGNYTRDKFGLWPFPAMICIRETRSQQVGLCAFFTSRSLGSSEFRQIVEPQNLIESAAWNHTQNNCPTPFPMRGNL
jgi:hypothetical protein